jgi:hypothetical protein
LYLSFIRREARRQWIHSRFSQPSLRPAS